jgi:hypothetical protein
MKKERKTGKRKKETRKGIRRKKERNEEGKK